MNVYDFVGTLGKTITASQLSALRMAMEDRMDTIEGQEPLSDGVIYDNWQEKYDDISDIVDSFDDLENALDEGNEDEVEELLKDLVDAIESHQLFYGGLKRQKIYI